MTKTAPRLYINAELIPDKIVTTEVKIYNYLINVMKRIVGDEVMLFNEKSGEWLGQIISYDKKSLKIIVLQHINLVPKMCYPQINIAFAPIKNENTTLIVQKATELGVANIIPIMTERTVVRAVNIARMNNIIIESSEQCGRITIPHIHAIQSLEKFLSHNEDILIFCDEKEKNQNIITTLQKISKNKNITLLIGPEGGFNAIERALILQSLDTHAVCLSINILRSETAAISALSITAAMLLREL